jgi:hypothetical protein
MAKLPSTFAFDTGEKLSDRFFDVRWLSTELGVPPPKRWYVAGEELPIEEPTEWGRGEVDDDGRLVVKYYRKEVFGSEDEVVKLWFVLLDNRHIQPAHLVLLGFADNRYPWGTVVDASEASRVLKKEYVSTWAGMINWRAGDPEIQQITTAPSWRRKRISIMMFGVCDVVNACYGFSPGKVIHGGAITTEDGEKLRNIYPGGSSRIDQRIGSVEKNKTENG